jgi:hypothetical protein
VIETIVKAASIPKWVQSAEPFAEPMPRQHALIVGGTHLMALSNLFPNYALAATVVIPSTVSCIDREVEFERAVQFEGTYEELCKGVGYARDLSGFDSDSVDFLFVCTLYPEVRAQFLAHAWRVVKELAKVVVFTDTEISPSTFANFGIAAAVYYPAEGFYIGTMRKAASVYSRS